MNNLGRSSTKPSSTAHKASGGHSAVRFYLRLLVSTALLLTFALPTVRAQIVETGTITGVVHDNSDAVISSAQKSTFSWVPFWWGFFIICVADDLTQYWYHRLHHQIPWFWRFHRTHHSASYMGMSMASRQNAFYTIFFSQIYLTSALVYLGLGPSALLVQTIKSMITTLAHSSITWDKPFYKYRALHPVAWVLERLISTPATHHAHHAATTDDGIGYYKGNFGNMFFLWDVFFGTAHISRQYPPAYRISHYENDQWYAQFLWPVLKSKVKGSELAADGPVVRVDALSTPTSSIVTQGAA